MLNRWFAVFAVLLVASSGCATLTEAFREAGDQFTPGDRGPGSKHAAYLAGDTDTILVEISHSPGALWDQNRNAEDHFIQQIERITQKNVEIVSKQELPRHGQDYRYSLQELRDFHAEYQEHEDSEDTVVMHALFLDGKYDRERVAGVAFGAEAWALFMGEIRDITCSNDALLCDGVREWRVVRSVAIHEAGHLLGLVNCPLPMTHDREYTQDGDQCHSTNEDSVMYWAVVVRRGLTSLIGEQDVPWQFDQHDLNDARAIQQ